MSRALIVAGLILVALGLAWPWVTRLGLGRLPGDIIVQRPHASFYFPVVTCVLLSVVLSVILWLIRR